MTAVSGAPGQTKPASGSSAGQRAELLAADAQAGDKPVDGPVLAAVKADIAALGPLEVGARRSLAALALWTAGQIDARGADAPLAIVARATQELRSTLVELFREHHDNADDLARISDALSSPVGDGQDAGSPDPGSEGGADSAAAGEAPDAAPAGDR